MIDLKTYRKNKRLDQKSLADLSGLDQSIISKYENGISVSHYTTDRLLLAIPELNDYIKDDNISMAAEPEAPYHVINSTNSALMRIIEDQSHTIRELTRINAILVERMGTDKY